MGGDHERHTQRSGNQPCRRDAPARTRQKCESRRSWLTRRR
jgi:hypothetical protein